MGGLKTKSTAMNIIKKIAGINLIVLVAYTLLANLSFHGAERTLGVAIVMAYAVGLHVVICFLAMLYGFVNKNKPLGRAWLLTGGLVLVIGFSACLGSASL